MKSGTAQHRGQQETASAFPELFFPSTNKAWSEWAREVKGHSVPQLSINHYFYHLLKISISSVRCICNRKRAVCDE